MITNEAKAVELMTEALTALKGATSTRENSIAITKLEEAMMWSNKDRTLKGELKPNSTHVQGGE